MGDEADAEGTMTEHEPLMGNLRRSDRAMAREETLGFLASASVARVGTSSVDGWPYVVPLLFVADGAEVWFHNVGARGHLRSNIEQNPRVCLEVDEVAEVFPYGPAMCDTSVEYRSAIAFGTAAVVDDPGEKANFFDRFMQKYAAHITGRPEHVYPRLDATTVYRMQIETITGKRRDR